MIPQFVTDGLNAASGMLPALGIAILMQLLFDKKKCGIFLYWMGDDSIILC